MLVSTTSLFFFFNDTATTEIYTLSLHDALPILGQQADAEEEGNGDQEHEPGIDRPEGERPERQIHPEHEELDRKSTRLNSSHGYISYAVFCLKKKKKKDQTHNTKNTRVSRLNNI